jgi:hypothetical protein
MLIFVERNTDMSLDTIYSFALDRMEFIDGDYKDSECFSDLIYEGEGSAELEYQWMTFQPEGCGFEVCVEYTLSLRGGFDECPGDYWTPPSCDFYLDEAEISVSKILIDDIEACVSKDVETFFARLVENKINI